MRIVRFRVEGEDRYGLLEPGDHVADLRGAPYQGLERSGRDYPLSAVRLLAPCEPSKIVGVGLNYRDHAEELGLALPEEPMLFLKPPSSVIGPGETIRCPEASRRVDYEGELGVVIGRPTFRVPREEAARYILGYTCVNDVTARDLQAKDVQYTRAKGFDTFAPLGPWIETDLDPGSLEVETYLNGEKRQGSNTSRLVFDPLFLVHFVSWIMTLLPGDVIASGTPAGIGPMEPGDRVEVRIEGIGALRNPVGAWE